MPGARSHSVSVKTHCNFRYLVEVNIRRERLALGVEPNWGIRLIAIL
jgi:hypothetical protein